MQISELKDYIETGRELEFKVDDKMCSITHGTIDDKEVISFCEFNQPSIEVSNIEELLKIDYKGKTLQTVWEELQPNDIWIY